jgi:hypothetical protein
MTPAPPVTLEKLRQLALALPDVTEDLCHGTPAFYVRRKLMARIREDGETLAIKTDYAEREFRIMTNPAVFFVTDHYVGYPMMLARLPVVELEELRVLLEQAWHLVAPKRLLRENADT